MMNGFLNTKIMNRYFGNPTLVSECMSRKKLAALFLSVPLFLLLGVVGIESPELPIGEMACQWLWVSRLSILFSVCTVLGVVIMGKMQNSLPLFYFSVVWSLIFWGGVEAIWGLRQVYGFASSNHSLYKLTGSFFNPGPYSGYLAMVFPLCLNEWLQLKKKTKRNYMERAGYYLTGGVALLIICVLPAGMSRSAWMATVISGLWVCGMHYSWGNKLGTAWQEHRKRAIAFIAMVLIGLTLGGIALFCLKKDSADGRLFMWKICCRAIAERPLIGYGSHGFGYAYGEAQEKYFAESEYNSQEEMVAGSPEYAFNEYLQVMIEWGIPVLLFVLFMIVFCLLWGVKKQRWSACGGIVSLLVFSFSSYPMQLPAFVVSFFFLLAACVIGKSRLGWIIFSFLMGIVGYSIWKQDTYKECKEWANTKILYSAGAYNSAKESYQKLYPVLKTKGTFLFEYGHCLHKLKDYEASNEVLKRAMYYNTDPMILNIIAKNYQQQKQYQLAEIYLHRSIHRLPGRIYPYYLLAKLYAECDLPDKMKEMAEIVLTKEPKVHSTAIDEMRAEMKKLLLRP